MLVLASGTADTVPVPLIPLEIVLLVLAIVLIGVIMFFIVGYMKGQNKIQAKMQQDQKDDSREIRGQMFEIAMKIGIQLPDSQIEDTPVYQPDRWGGLHAMPYDDQQRSQRSRPMRYGTGG